jgi:hypothetical protein
MFKMQNATRNGLGAFLIVAFVTMAIPHTAQAQGFSVTVRIDENGHGLLTNTAGVSAPLSVALQNDPGPGGLTGALTYGLLSPPGLTAGDLVLAETPAGIISDVIRFNPDETCFLLLGCLVFYSDKLDPIDSLADIGFPTAFYANLLTVNEIGPEGNNGFSYTPLAGQPGFVAGAAGPVTYIIQSDVPNVPEPSSILLLGTGLGAVILVCRKRVCRHLPL